ncbi:MAG: SDR family NAD(P)-dependent oxidoreductase [Kiritimatiellia bacterium]|nr:SDR family NAD(P)-dependent oxidoreductase [Kiritimatiellia bacterium]
MAPITTDKKNLRQLYFALPILRGLLAKRSGHEDDPYSRVIIYSASQAAPLKRSSSDGVPPLRLKAWEANASVAVVRDQFRAAIDQFNAQYGRMPTRIMPAKGSLFYIAPRARGNKQTLRNKIAVVTGAAGAIGAGICRSLLEHGYHVAATDLIRESLDDLVKELKTLAPGRIIGVQMDVTDKKSVTIGFSQVTCRWGGVDIIVANAGIAMVAPLMDLDPGAFRKLEKVNIEGTLLTLAEAGRCLCRQNTGGDIILVSTKNVFSPGAQFGAYSATKAASHQLARIASLEYAQFDIRVNMVAPDAVFSDGKRKSGLWAEIGPSRMKARGLDEKGLEEYYRNRNLLKARVTAAHVANAVLFFATRQTPTTGATIPVDGGLPDATPR